MRLMTEQINEVIGELPLEKTFSFSNDKQDEFFIKDGEKQIGIFKVWPSKLLNIIEGDQIENSHLKRMVAMKKWLTFITLQDKSLQKSFDKNPSGDENHKASILFAQMEKAFSILEPFYSIEAMVDNKNNIENGNENTINQGGEMDIIALMLPGLFEDTLKKCNTHEEIFFEIINLKEGFHKNINSIEGKKITLLSLISRKLGITFEEIVFAAKMLGKVHTNKTFDTSSLNKAINILQKSFRRNSDSGSKHSIDADINARLRFMNWLPIEISDSNFQWDKMNYDSICCNAGSLFEILCNNSTLINEDKQNWFDEIKDQLKNIDASSARGRFILQMFNEQILSPELIESIKNIRNKIDIIIPKNITKDFFSFPKSHVELNQVGGKGLGLFLANSIFNNNNNISIPDIHVIPWTWVNEFLNNIPQFQELLDELEETNSIEIGNKIINEIEKLTFSNEFLIKIRESLSYVPHGNKQIIFRSSALIEDTEDIGSAPGVFESFMMNKGNKDISKGIKGVIQSWFSEKAILFRNKKGLGHSPVMSILVQPVYKGKHGAMFVTENGIDINISSSNVNDHNNEVITKHIDFNSKNRDNEIENRLNDIAKKTFHIFGPIDIEFIIQDKEIFILQLRMLDHKETNTNSTENNKELFNFKISSMDDFKDITTKNINLIIGETIDINQFNNDLFVNIIKFSENITSVTLNQKIALTSHFSNIINTLGIKLHQPE